jgi:hypothetical protein
MCCIDLNTAARSGILKAGYRVPVSHLLYPLHLFIPYAITLIISYDII